MEKKLDFNIMEFMQSQGFSPVREDAGRVVFADSEGEADFNPTEYLASQGIDPNEVNIQFNDPLTAMDSTSPVGLIDRAKLSFGNTKGKVSYLKSKFEDATYVPDQGLVVKDKGVWKRVDPSEAEIGDVFDLAEDVLKTGAMIGGGAAAGPAGGIAASAAAAAGSTVLGKLVGTYTPESMEEVASEILWDTAFSAIGYGVMPAVRGTKQFFSNLTKRPSLEGFFTSLGNVSDKMSGFAKSAYSNLITTATNAPEATVMEVLARPQPVWNKISSVIKASPTAGEQELVRKMAVMSNRRMQAAIPQLRDQWLNNFKTLEQNFIAQAGKAGSDFVFDPKVAIKGLAEQFTSKGLLRMQFGSSGQIAAFKSASPRNIAPIIGGNMAEARFIASKMDDVARALNPLLRQAPLTGASGARSALQLRRLIDGIAFKGNRGAPLSEVSRNYLLQATDGGLDAIRTVLNDTLKGKSQRAVTQAGRSALARAEIGFTRMNQYYTRYKSHFNALDNLVRADTKADPFLSDMFRNLNRGARPQIVEDLLNLNSGFGNAPGRGTMLLRDALDTYVGSEFVRIFPKTRGVQSGVLQEGIQKAAAITGLTSPRAQMQAIAYGDKLRRWIKTMPVDQKMMLLQDNELFPAAVSQVFRAAAEEDSEEPQLMQALEAELGQ